jgi:hypothetical protein
MERKFKRIITDLQWYIGSLLNNWSEQAGEPNLINVICESRKWKPMETGEEITVHFDFKEYKIVRIK